MKKDSPVADYLELLAARIREGTYEISLEKTTFGCKVNVDVVDGVLVEYDAGVDDSQWRETLKISKVEDRFLC